MLFSSAETIFHVQSKMNATSILLLLIAFISLFNRAVSDGNIFHRVIVNVDVGLDDYLALLVLLHAEKLGHVKIEAIVCTFGNTDGENVTKHVVRLLEMTGRTDIPVYRGVDERLILHGFDDPPIPDAQMHAFGYDGFGDLQYDSEPDMFTVKKTVGSLAIYDLVTEHPNEITLICLAPLTTIAVTLKVFDDLVGLVRDVWIMGGHDGNSTELEFNFYLDPESAHVVLEKVKRNIYVYPWESCQQNAVDKGWYFETLKGGPPTFELLLEAEEKIPLNRMNKPKRGLCDALMVFAYLYPENILTKTRHRNVTIELYKKDSRMSLSYDDEKNENEVDIIKGLNVDRFKELLLEMKTHKTSLTESLIVSIPLIIALFSFLFYL